MKKLSTENACAAAELSTLMVISFVLSFNPNERLNQMISWSHFIFNESKSDISSQASTCGGGQASTPVSTSSSPMIHSSLPSKYVKKHEAMLSH